MAKLKVGKCCCWSRGSRVRGKRWRMAHPGKRSSRRCLKRAHKGESCRV